VVSDARIPALADVPTMTELGYPAASFTAGGLIVPAGTSPAVLGTLESACAEATARGEYKAIAARLNVEARYLPGDAFRKLFAADSMENADAVQRAGLATR
jgi:tripartite-type tricarboxylate transporter receptor subunit TctC